MSSIFDYLSSSALSLSMAGNTGISPFLTLFLLALIEKIEPEWLNVGPLVENILTSWWALIVLGILAVLEILAKCIPALDEVVDSIEVFVVPILSVLATLSTVGTLPEATAERRMLEESIATGTADDNNGINFGAAFLTATKVVLVIAGMILSLLIHFLKMIVRLASIGCSAGCCQPCITTVELTVVCIGVVFCILSPIFAMIACGLFFVGAWYVVTVKCCCKKKEDEDDEEEEDGEKENKQGDEESPAPTAEQPATETTNVEAKVY